MTCPPRHVLAALAHDDIPNELSAGIIRHAAGCPTCLGTLREFSDPGRLAHLLDSRPANAPPDRRVKWFTPVLVAAAAAAGLAVALGSKVREQVVALRGATAAATDADATARRATAEARLDAARAAFARGIAALDDGDPAGAADLARAAAAARGLADSPDLGESAKSAAAALAELADRQADRWPPPPRPKHVGYSPRLAVLTADRKRLVTAADEPRLVVWHAATGAAVAECSRKGGPVGRFEAVAVSPDGRWVAAAEDDGRVWVWDMPAAGTALPVASPIELKDERPVWVLAFTPPEGAVALPTLWAGGSGGPPRPRAFAPAPREPASGSPPTELDRAAGAGVAVGPLRRGRPVLAAGADPTGRFAFTADPDGTFRYWDVRTRAPVGAAHRTAPAAPPR